MFVVKKLSFQHNYSTWLTQKRLGNVNLKGTRRKSYKKPWQLLGVVSAAKKFGVPRPTLIFTVVGKDNIHFLRSKTYQLDENIYLKKMYDYFNEHASYEVDAIDDNIVLIEDDYECS